MRSKFIPYGKQSLNEADIRAVTRVLRSPLITQGPEVERFENAMARYCGVPYAVAVSSGTAGLHLACLAAGFGKGDEVITSPMSFVATANAILYAGAKPRFVDIEPRGLGLDPKKIQKHVSKKTKGIVSVHFAGHPSRINRKNLIVIEDACHALGAKYLRDGRWEKVGSSVDADMCVFSFHPVKHITTGEGGLVTTRRKELYEKLKLLRTHGIKKDTSPGKPWVYEMQALGFNYRITDFQCALGLSQLTRLDAMVKRRRQIARFYDKSLSDLRHVSLPCEEKGVQSSYHLYVLRINFKHLGKPREKAMSEFRKEGIGTQVHYIPIPSQPYYQALYGHSPKEFPESQRYYEEALSIPMYSAMTDSDCRRVVTAAKKILRPAHVA